MKLASLFVAVAALLVPLSLLAAEPASRPDKPQTNPPLTKPSAPAGDKLSVTEHEATIGGTTLKYRATAGTHQLKDEAGKAKADLFSVAYERLPAASAGAADAAKRPVTFVFNGGPGAASVWLHLGTAGPKRVKLTAAGEAPPPPYGVVDNEHSWLDATDLVFIDPVGTGYSRAAAGEDPKQFYGVEEDLRSVSEFIRLWTTRNGRWPSPKFLAGESYGTTRAAGLSRKLLEDQGIAVNGIVLISTVLSFQTISFAEGNDLPYVTYLPTYTAVAHYHKKLPPDLQADLSAALKASERFAATEYAAALARGSGLSDAERDAAARQVSRLTGLEERLVRRANLRVDPDLFRKSLLTEASRVIGRFDARLTGYDADPVGREPDHDPSFNQFYAAYAGAFNDYVRRGLRYESDLPYNVLTGRVQPWNWGGGGGWNGFLDVSGNLADALRKSPHTRVMVCSGLYDLATPYAAASHTVNHLRLSPELRRNVTETFYPGGHMMYHEASALRDLKADVARFIEGAK